MSNMHNILGDTTVNAQHYWQAEGVKVPVPFKCQRCLVNDANYGRNGQWRCSVCWQLEAAQEV